MELLSRLLKLKCPAGFEARGKDKLKKIAQQLCYDVQEDALGNIMARVTPISKELPTILVCAHYDSIGLIVTGICDGGFLKFAPLGGVDNRMLPGAEVTVLGDEDIYGVIGLRPVHILKKEDMEKSETPENLCIDTSLNKEKLSSLVKVGTPVIFESEPIMLENSVSASYMDNRAGVYIALSLAKEVKKTSPEANIVLLFSASEELGRRGAAAAAENLDADVAVIVDATFGKTPWCSNGEAKKLGEGPVICTGPVLNRKYTNLLIKTAEEKGIKYQVEAEGGDPGTDSFVIETTSGGTPCVMVSYPLKYMHQSVETASFSDLHAAADLIKCFVWEIGGKNNA